MILTVI